jgi:hypothetical protein
VTTIWRRAPDRGGRPNTDNRTSARLVTSPSVTDLRQDAPRRAREGRWQFLVPHGLGDAGGHAPGLVAVSSRAPTGLNWASAWLLRSSDY